MVDVKVTRHGVVRRAKLFFLRDRIGKATRLKERRVAVVTTETKKRGRKRGAKAKLERKARAAAAPKTRKKKKSGEAKA